LFGAGALGSGVVRAAVSSVDECEPVLPQVAAGEFDQLFASSPCTYPRRYPCASFRLHACFGAHKVVRFVERERPWPADLASPVLTVTDPEAWRGAGELSAARRAAVVRRVREVARALGLRAHIAFGAQDGVHLPHPASHEFESVRVTCDDAQGATG